MYGYRADIAATPSDSTTPPMSGVVATHEPITGLYQLNAETQLTCTKTLLQQLGYGTSRRTQCRPDRVDGIGVEVECDLLVLM